jgi:competence protein ComEA
MTNSLLLQHNSRTALAARDILSFKHRGAIGALILALLLGVGMLAGSSFALAQENSVPATPAVSTASAQVNINTADAQTLAANLKGVGESRAAEIVRYREAYGPFASAEELVEVKGIGNSTLDMNRDLITLE